MSAWARLGRSALLSPFVWLPTLGVAAVLAVYFSLPVERVGLVGVRLLFEGADRGRYPNGTPFSADELIARPVLRTLYDNKSELAKRGSFDEFASAFFVWRSARDVEIVHATYRARLADPKLSPVDRSRIETEYRARLESAGGEPELVLGMRQPWNDVALSEEEVGQLLDATLQAWVQAAETTQGVLRHDIDVPAQNGEDGRVESAEVLIRLDALRVTLQRELLAIDRMAKLPGFSGMVLASDGRSIDDIRAEVGDLLTLRVQPLVRFAAARGIGQSKAALDAYFDARLAGTLRHRTTLAHRAAGMRQALQDYSTRPDPSGGAVAGPARDGTTLMPQMSDGFLERLFALAGSANDIGFRQDLTNELVRLDLELALAEREQVYYQQLRTAVAGMSAGGDGGNGDAARVIGEIEGIERAVAATGKRVQGLYEEGSKLSLGTAQNFYQVSQRFTLQSKRAMSGTRAASACLAAILAGLAMAALVQRGVPGLARLPRRGSGGQQS